MSVMSGAGDPSSPTGTVVIVDDNPNNLRVLGGILQQDGYKVRSTRDGVLALRSIASALPDLVLLDIRMPGLDGFEVCRQLKQDPKTRDVPVIFISALNEMVDKIEAFKIGAVDYVTKPFQIEEVLARVRTHMQLAHMQRHLEHLVDQRTGELREKEARYRSLVNQAADAILLLSREGRVLEANHQAGKMLGCNCDELIEADFGEIDPGLDAQWFGSAMMAAEQGERTTYERLYRRKDGSELPVEARVGPVMIKGDLHLLVLVRDISERYIAEAERERSRQRLHTSMVQTIEAISTTLEKRDPYTAGHQRRVAKLAEAIASGLGWDKGRREGIRFGALIHDVGKIAVPAELLNRPGRLGEVELALVRLHTEQGRDIVAGVDFPWAVGQMIYQHHERMNGSGYPQGLKGEDILLEARVLAVADVVEAMASHRPYRSSLGLDKALDEIRSGRGELYDPQVADACLSLFETGVFAFDSKEA